MRSKGDNSRATTKLVQIAKTEKDETLRSRALRQLGRIPGDDGATQLISIYDSLQDSKEKQLVIRYLATNKSKKAADKLVQIAKTDADPAVRSSAIRSLYAIDNRLYLDLRDKISGDFHFAPMALGNLHDNINSMKFHFDTDEFKLHQEELKRVMEDQKELFENHKLLRFENFKFETDGLFKEKLEAQKELKKRNELEKKIR